MGRKANLTISPCECLSLLSFLCTSLNDLPEILQELPSKLRQLLALGPNHPEHPLALEGASDEQHQVSPVVIWTNLLIVIPIFSGAIQCAYPIVF